jgi:hypothetical protein
VTGEAGATGVTGAASLTFSPLLIAGSMGTTYNEGVTGYVVEYSDGVYSVSSLITQTTVTGATAYTVVVTDFPGTTLNNLVSLASLNSPTGVLSSITSFPVLSNTGIEYDIIFASPIAAGVSLNISSFATYTSG